MQHFHNEPSASASMFGRATDVMSRVLLARDEQGHAKANSAYLFGAMLTSVIATAHQPYTHHDPGEVFGNFGSTVGSTAGMNLFHEFWPQLKQRLSTRVPHVLQKSVGTSKDQSLKGHY
jgi:hypothetical protein